MHEVIFPADSSSLFDIDINDYKYTTIHFKVNLFTFKPQIL